eukprot:jgi/Undpi1/12091/HiC_scaffold_4.g01789.m1
MIEVDHSAGHAKYRENGLHVRNMNVRFGGRQRALAAGYHYGRGVLGSVGGEDIYLNRDVWSTQFIEGVTTRTVDMKPESAETPTMSFPLNAPPPFYACDAPRSDVMRRKVRDKQTKRPPQEADGGGSVGTGLEMGVIQEGAYAASPGARETTAGRTLRLKKGGDIESKDMIEKIKKKCKAHRNILDMEPGYIDKQ